MKTTNKKGLWSNILSKFYFFDVMGESIQFRIEGGTHKKSLFGALVSLGVIALTLVQLNSKFFDMVNYNNTNHMQSMTALDDFEISVKDKFQMVILLEPGPIAKEKEYEELSKAIHF